MQKLSATDLWLILETAYRHDIGMIVRDGVVRLVAEFARRRHAQRSHDVVRQPSSIGLASPRTHLVPARLDDLIGRIATSHGKSLEETLKLPYRESGMGMDHAHPRFVACLLRLGDLLDRDNGRFCPTLLATLGGLPATSKAHVGKHAAVVHLDIASDRIDVQAQCEDYPLTRSPTSGSAGCGVS